jgi:hypothetical protein
MAAIVILHNYKRKMAIFQLPANNSTGIFGAWRGTQIDKSASAAADERCRKSTPCRSAARGRPVVEAIYLGFSRGSK